jgi:hypothetical protein
MKRKISISVALKAPVCILFNRQPGPPVRAPLSVRTPLEPIKGRAHSLEHKVPRLSQVLQALPGFSSSPQAIQHTSGRRVSRSGGLNHSKSLCVPHVHWPLDLAFLDFPQTHPRLGLGGCIPPPGWRFPPTRSGRRGDVRATSGPSRQGTVAGCG